MRCNLSQVSLKLKPLPYPSQIGSPATASASFSFSLPHPFLPDFWPYISADPPARPILLFFFPYGQHLDPIVRSDFPGLSTDFTDTHFCK